MASPRRTTPRARINFAGVAMPVWAPLLLLGCAATTDTAVPVPRVREPAPLIAIFPVENLSGRPAPLAEIQGLLARRLAGYGLGVLDDATLERVITAHRVRYLAGVGPAFTRALREEAGVDGILIPSLELYDEGNPPRVALFARLVSAGDAPVVRWIDSRGAAGDDAPGILGIGLVYDPLVLLARAVDGLARSLARHAAEGGVRIAARPPVKKFRPKLVYRSALEPGRRYTVAVVPFFNKSARKYAGEITALHMMRNLMTFPDLEVVEPGMVREEMLRFRIIMSDGVSLPQTDTILNAVSADLVLNGEVLEYRDSLGLGAAPSVDFAVLFIERRTRRVVFSSYSQNAGDDEVYFFDWGRVNTAHAMASEMARAIGQRMVLGPPTATTR